MNSTWAEACVELLEGKREEVLMDPKSIRRGMKVRVPLGTMVLSTQDGSWAPSKQPRAVLVIHVTKKVERLLAIRYNNDGGQLVFQGSPRDQIGLCEVLGLPCGTDEQIRASLESLVDKARVEQHFLSAEYLYIETTPARVAWIGQGGYWRYVDASAVTPHQVS